MAFIDLPSVSGRNIQPLVQAFPSFASLRVCPGSCSSKASLLLPSTAAISSKRRVQTCAAMVADAPVLPGGKGSGMETVGDVMSFKKVFFVKPATTIDEALDMLVQNRITGLPVLDDDGKVVGVVSDFDLLSLDHISGERVTSGIFPDVTTDWGSFQEVQKLILKSHGRVVEDVMTPDPIVVSRETSLETAAKTLLDKRIRRLPVVDDAGFLVGMFSRGDVIKAALQTRKQIKSVSSSISEDI